MRCAVDVAPVRAEPRDDAEQLTQLLAGEPAEVDELRDGWARVRTAYAYRGWARLDELEEGEGGSQPTAAGRPSRLRGAISDRRTNGAG